MLGGDGHRQPLLSEAVTPSAWRAQLIEIDLAFELARDAPGTVIPCRSGCSACCTAVFEIHAADATVLREGLASLPGPARDRIVARAAAVRSAMAAAAEKLEATEPAFREWLAVSLDGVPARALGLLAGAIDLPCPVLDETGACSMHAFRPAICRMQGLPWQDPVTGAALPDFCRLETGQEGNSPQPLDLLGLDEAREAAAAGRGVGWPARMTVAGALAPHLLGQRCPR